MRTRTAWSLGNTIFVRVCVYVVIARLQGARCREVLLRVVVRREVILSWACLWRMGSVWATRGTHSKAVGTVRILWGEKKENISKESPVLQNMWTHRA